MVLVLAVAAGALVVALATGGARLAAVRVRAVRLLVVAAAVQLGTSMWAPGSGTARVVALVLTVVLVGLFLAGNARLAGVPLVALGLFLNVVVIGLNGAMPVSVEAADRAGLSRAELGLGTDALREATGPSTRLAALGDVVPVALPRWPQVVSPGDVLVAAGVGLLLLTASRPRRRQGAWRAARPTVCESDSTTVGSYS